MKKLLAIVLCAALTLALAGCSGEQAQSPSPETTTPAPAATETPTPEPTEPPMSLSMASAAALTDTVKGNALSKGFDDLKAWSGGSMVIEFFEGGDKGTDEDIIEAVKNGGISIYTGDASMMAEAIPQLAVLDAPMMFTALDACNTVLSGSFTDMMQPFFNDAGLQLIGVYSTSFKYLTTGKPIAASADFYGLRISTSKSQYSKSFWKTLGCNVMPLERSEVYIALKQGLLEAQENVCSEISALKFYEVQTNMYKTRHGQDVDVYVMNKAQYEALTGEQKEWLGKFISQVISDEITAAGEYESEQEKAFKKMTVAEPVPEMLAALKAAVQPVIDEMKQNIDPALVDQYLSACGYAGGTSAPAVSGEPTTSSTASPEASPSS
jgi:TRAP-type C4-dicarboxylate transport system substrate-binding protein